MHAIPYYKIIILIGCPFAFCFLLALFWMLYKFYSKQNIFRIFESFSITIIITFFYFQSPVINALADLLSCTKIETNFYLTNYLLEKCTNNQNYENWLFFVIIPFFCFFSLILPLVPLLYMFKYKSYLYTEKKLLKVGFLLNGYSPQYYYW